ncbi:MAG: DUF2723 domain-containing protein [Chloroflexi bacterium]|nr:DUF2723 domain-containing protein [Chloroflexota bacterium]
MAIKRTKIPEAICIVVLLAVYLTTMPPSLTWAHDGSDGGDLVTAVARGSLPHPPGYPIYLIVAKLFLKIPWGDPAWRLNLLSASMMAIAGGLVVAAVRRLRESIQPTVAICAGLCFGLAPLVWSQALIVEVYALAVAFIATILFLIFIDAPMWLIGIVWGIGMGAHPSIVLLAPLIVWRAWRNRAYGLIEVALGAFIGWDLVFGPLLLLQANSASPWGDVSTVDGWWSYATAQIYRGYVFGAPFDTLLPKSMMLLRAMLEQLTPVGAVIVIVGWIALWRERRALSIATLATVGVIVAFALFYNTVDSQVYMILAMPMVGLALAFGLSQIATWLSGRWQWGSVLILLLPLLQVVFFWNGIDLHGDRTAMNWAERVLRDAPPRAILVTAEDKYTFALWYVHDVLALRPDVIVVDRDLWEWKSYRDMMKDLLKPELSLDNLARDLQRPLIDVGAFP